MTSSQTSAPGETVFDLDRGWRLHSAVAVRPEPFGALLYHFHTRKLSFLKSPQLVEVVQALEEHDTARAACAARGVAIDDPAVARLYLHALGSLVDSRMIELQPAGRGSTQEDS